MGVEASKRYEHGPNGKEAHWRKRQTEAYKKASLIRTRRFQATEKGQLALYNYRRSPKAREDRRLRYWHDKQEKMLWQS
jgi:hypothetical protein